MGWTSYRADYYKNYKVDRLSECRANINCEFYEIVADGMVGGTYYGAVRNKRTSVVNGVVILTSVQGNDFACKVITEDMGPSDCECPAKVLKELSPTSNRLALDWRDRCCKNLELKRDKTLEKLPLCSVISIKNSSGNVIDLVKSRPYKGKTVRWVNMEKMEYIPAKVIKEIGYEVVKVGGA